MFALVQWRIRAKKAEVADKAEGRNHFAERLMTSAPQPASLQTPHAWESESRYSDDA